MSATGRSDVRLKNDAYYTPAWCVHALLREVRLPPGRWLEPAAGEGAIIRAVTEVMDGVEWYAAEVRKEACKVLYSLDVPTEERDWLKPLSIVYGLEPRVDVVITNPPYSLAMEFIQRAFKVTNGPVVMLLRLPFLASQKRAAFFREHAPDIYILPKRPSFTSKGSDATDYAWFVWPSRIPRAEGRVKVLEASNC